MGIKDPSTYGDWYWKNSVDAAKFLAEESEQELSAMAARLMGRLDIGEVLPAEFMDLFREIEAPAGAFLGEIGGRFVSEIADGAVSRTASPLMESIGYLSYMKWPTKKITPDATARLFLRKQVSPEFFEERFRMGGFEPIEAQFQVDSMRPYPSISDLVLYSRYHGDADAPWGEIQNWLDVSEREWPVFKWLGLQRLTTLQLQTLYRRGLAESTELYSELAKVGWSEKDRPFIEELGWSVPNAMLLIQGNLQQEQNAETILADISHADIHPKFAQTYLDGILTKPSSMDLIAYELRKDPDLSNIEDRLRKVGIHPDYFGVYKELAYFIPPVSDLITMAVREAFTPTIAAKFGQYEDFPPAFEEFAAKKGVTKEWAERYWAAHWSLPSSGQGFEMLHRGAINQSELDLLLRALDVMPFWRDKLTKIAYRRLSRVDIRRMYQRGILDELEVLEAYSELGYNERDAKRMADFSVKQVLATQSKFTAANIIAAYSKYMINRDEAASLLREVGVRRENISTIISSAEYKREWALTDDRIAAIRNLYKKEVYDDNKARSELLKLDFPAERVNVLMEQWYIDEKDKPDRLWTTAQTLGFMKDKIISQERGVKELTDIGYNIEHINAYLRAM